MFFLLDCLENAARAYGLPDAELFQTVDLFEKRNIGQVTQCIHALGRHVKSTCFYLLRCFYRKFSLGPKEKLHRSNFRTKNGRCKRSRFH